MTDRHLCGPGEQPGPVSSVFAFDTGFLRKLERLEVLAKKVFRGHLRGEHTTQRRGAGLEFE